MPIFGIFKIPVFIYSKSGSINCRDEGNGSADAPDDDNDKDNNDLGYPVHCTYKKINSSYNFSNNCTTATNKQC